MIKGKVIGLRAVEKEDLPHFREWRNLEEFRRNFREIRELNLADQEKWFDSLQSTRNINFMFTIVDLKTQEPIGAAGLLYINWAIRSADFSFYIGKDQLYIDQTYAFDAAQTLLRYGFHELNLNKVWMELYEYDNQKLEFFDKKFGFVKEGTLRQNSFSRGKYWDSHIISILANEFNPQLEKLITEKDA